MAVRFDSATTDAMRLSSGLLDYNAAYTIMAWVYPVSNPSADMQPFSIAVDGSNLDQMRTGSGATSWSVRSIVGGSAVATGTTSVDYTTWQHLAMVRTDSSNVYLWKDGNQSTASNQAAGGRSAATQLDVGNGRGGTTPMNGRMYAVKAWTVALSAAEIAQEMRSVRPVRLANLWGWWPTRPGASERLKDYSGQGRSFTEIGTLSDEDPHSIWWGARGGRKLSPSGTIYQFTLALTSASTTKDTVALLVARALTLTDTSASTTPDTAALPIARALTLADTSASTTPGTAVLLSLVFLVAAATSTSSTPDTTALPVARALTLADTSASTTPDTPALPVARALMLTDTSASTTPDTVTMLRAMAFALATSSASTTPGTAALVNLVAFALAVTSGSITPDSAAILRALAFTLAIQSTSLTTFLLEPRASLIFDVPAQDRTSSADITFPFAVAAQDRTSIAKRTFPFVVAARSTASEA
jgi:hypothetical protein